MLVVKVKNPGRCVSTGRRNLGGEELARKALGVADGPTLYWRPWQAAGHGERPRCRKGMCSVLEAETNDAWMEQGGVTRNSFL